MRLYRDAPVPLGRLRAVVSLNHRKDVLSQREYLSFGPLAGRRNATPPRGVVADQLMYRPSVRSCSLAKN
jgi:hypothetical protein